MPNGAPGSRVSNCDVDLSRRGSTPFAIGEREPDRSDVARHVCAPAPDPRSRSPPGARRRRRATWPARRSRASYMQRGVPHRDRRLGETHDAAAARSTSTGTPDAPRHRLTRVTRPRTARRSPRQWPSSSGRPSARVPAPIGDVAVAERRAAVHTARGEVGEAAALEEPAQVGQPAQVEIAIRDARYRQDEHSPHWFLGLGGCRRMRGGAPASTTPAAATSAHASASTRRITRPRRSDRPGAANAERRPHRR